MLFYQNCIKLFCEYQKTDSKMYVENQDIQNDQQNIGEQKQRTDAIKIQNPE